MIKFTKLTDYAIATLCLMVPNPDKSISSLRASDITLLPVTTVSKIFFALLEAEVLLSIRGRTGGYKLAGVAVDAVFDSVSVATTFKEQLSDLGIIFCSLSEAIREHSDLVQKYLGSVVPHTDNYFVALNAAVFSDGSFCYIPKGVRCPLELSTYFRINQANSGQFERTLIIAL